MPATKRITVCCETCGTTRKFQNYGCECIAGVRAEDAAGVVDILVITANQVGFGPPALQPPPVPPSRHAHTLAHPRPGCALRLALSKLAHAPRIT